MPVIPPAVPTTTVTLSGTSLVRRALRKLGVLGQGQQPKPAQTTEGLESLNDLLDSLSSEPHAIYAYVEATHVLTVGIDSYLIGTEGEIIVNRPERIEPGMAFLRRSSVDYPLEVLSVKEWAGIPDRTTSGQPTRLYYQPDAPLGTIHLDPAPDQADTLVLWFPMLLSQVLVSEAIVYFKLPPAYARYLVNQLAVELAPDYGKDPPLTAVLAANQAKANFKRMNAKTPKLRNDAPSAQHRSSTFDIERGY